MLSFIDREKVTQACDDVYTYILKVNHNSLKTTCTILLALLLNKFFVDKISHVIQTIIYLCV